MEVGSITNGLQQCFSNFPAENHLGAFKAGLSQASLLETLVQWGGRGLTVCVFTKFLGESYHLGSLGKHEAIFFLLICFEFIRD